MMNLKVVTSSGNAVANCLPVDFIAFEQHFDKPITVLEQGRITYLYWLAWTALRRADKNTVEDFNDWAATVVSIEQLDDDQIPPLESKASIG